MRQRKRRGAVFSVSDSLPEQAPTAQSQVGRQVANGGADGIVAHWGYSSDDSTAVDCECRRARVSRRQLRPIRDLRLPRFHATKPRVGLRGSRGSFARLQRPQEIIVDSRRRAASRVTTDGQVSIGGAATSDDERFTSCRSSLRSSRRPQQCCARQPTCRVRPSQGGPHRRPATTCATRRVVRSNRREPSCASNSATSWLTACAVRIMRSALAPKLSGGD